MDPIEPDYLLCAAGIILCLFGWALYWAGGHLLGAAAGAAAGAALGSIAVEFGDLAQYRLLTIAVTGAIGALLGIFIFRRIHFGALGILGAIIGIAAGLQTASSLQNAGVEWAQGQGALAIAAAVGLVGGALLFIVWHRHIITLATAAAGAMLIEMGLWLETPLVAGISAFLLSLMIQTGIARRLGLGAQAKEPDQDGDEDDEDDE